MPKRLSPLIDFFCLIYVRRHPRMGFHRGVGVIPTIGNLNPMKVRAPVLVCLRPEPFAEAGAALVALVAFLPSLFAAVRAHHHRAVPVGHFGAWPKNLHPKFAGFGGGSFDGCPVPTRNYNCVVPHVPHVSLRCK